MEPISLRRTLLLFLPTKAVTKGKPPEKVISKGQVKVLYTNRTGKARHWSQKVHPAQNELSRKMNSDLAFSANYDLSE
jgi:hypothetical protein